MKLKIKDVNIATGGTLVAIMNEDDIHEKDIHVGDRISLKKGKYKTVAVVDVAQSSKLVKKGCIGLMEEVLSDLHAKGGDSVKIDLEDKPFSVHLIKRKLEGKLLTSEEIEIIVKDIVLNKLTAIEVTYFVAATFVRGMKLSETVALTKAMISTGDVLKLDCYPIIDKHCIGGVPGNRTTMLVVPILIAAGYCVPKTSSRSITSPAGTADVMEVLSNVSISVDKMKKIIEDVGGCMTWGGAVNLAPADDKFITVEHPLSIDAESQLLASILAKKGSVSASHVLIDIPTGQGAKVVTQKKAKRLKKLFEVIGSKIGMKIKVIITDGSQPIGHGIGPALEAKDVLYILKNDARGPKDLREKAIAVAGAMMKEYPLPYWKKKNSVEYARELLDNGKAWDVMKNIIVAQGKKHIDPEKIKVGKYTYDYTAWKSGRIKSIANKKIAYISKLAGAPMDKGAGMYLYKHVSDIIQKDEPLFTIYAESLDKLKQVQHKLKKFDGIEID